MPSVESGRRPGTSLGYTRSESRKLSRTNSSPSIKRQSIRLRLIRSSNCSSVNSGHSYANQSQWPDHATPKNEAASRACDTAPHEHKQASEGSGFCSKRRSQAATACVKYPASLRRRISGGSPISRWRKSSLQTSTEQPTGPSSITFPSEGSTSITAIPKLQVTRTLEAHCSEIKKKAPIKEPPTLINGAYKK